MRLGRNRRNIKSADSNQSKANLAQVVLELGRYVSIQTQEFLKEIRESADPVNEVSKRSIQEFAKVGMPELIDPYQKLGAGKIFIEKLRDLVKGKS